MDEVAMAYFKISNYVIGDGPAKATNNIDLNVAPGIKRILEYANKTQNCNPRCHEVPL
jgi:hypothetical protein